MEWEKSAVEPETQYKSFMSKEIKVKVGVNIGLRGVNVTLKGLVISWNITQNILHEPTTQKYGFSTTQGEIFYGW